MLPLPVGETAAVSAAALWAFTSLVFTEAGRMATPLAANTFKTIMATLLFGIVLWIRDGVPWGRGIEPADAALLAASGLCGLMVGDSLLFLGFQALGTRRANLVFSLAPVLGAIGGLVFLGERLGGRELIGMVAALAGVAWVVSVRRRAPLGSGLLASMAPPGEIRRHPLEGRILIGVLLTLGAALGQATGALLAKPALERVATIEATQIRVAAAAVGLLASGALGGRLRVWTGLIVRRRLLVGLALASLLGPFVGIWLMTVSLDRAPAGVALTLLGTTPVWLLPLGAWLQHDRPTRREVIGLLVALAGVTALLISGG